MTNQVSFEVDTSSLTSMEFDSVCECETVNILTGEIVAKCDNVAVWIATYHGIRPCTDSVTKLVCQVCLTSINSLNCTDCGAERLISSIRIKGPKRAK